MSRDSEDYMFRNTFGDIRIILETLSEAGTRFEPECYGLARRYNLAHFVDQNLVKPPFFIQMILGNLGGAGPNLENLTFLKSTADQLFGRDDRRWSVLVTGRHQMPFITQAALMGGNIRVGLEDSLSSAGQLATSNPQQVSKIVRILVRGVMSLPFPPRQVHFWDSRAVIASSFKQGLRTPKNPSNRRPINV